MEKGTKDPSKLEHITKWTYSKSQGRRYCGWKAEGLLEFNEIYKKVKKDREQEMGKVLEDRIEFHYMQYKKNEEAEAERQKENRRVKVMTYPDPVDLEYDKWSDEE